MEVTYDIDGIRFNFKCDDGVSESELRSLLGKMRGAATAQTYRNEIDSHRRNIFANEQQITAEQSNLNQFMASFETKQNEFAQIGGRGEYQMSKPEQVTRDKHRIGIETCQENIKRSEKEIKLLEKLLSG